MALRLRQIALVAHDLDRAERALGDVLGLAVCYRDPGVAHFGLANFLMPIGNQFLEVVAPTREGTAGGRYLERRGGDGGYMVITQCEEHAPYRARVGELGVRIVHQFETPTFRNMQLHPKDTGGSFFEIDQQLGPQADAADGPWTPAGGDGWQTAKRTERVTGIVAAEIQADDPERVAARWSEIAAIAVTRDPQGRPELPLADARIRFVPCTDGRPEGLGGLDLAAADRDAALAAAEAGGYAVDGDTVRLCGLRLRLKEAATP